MPDEYDTVFASAYNALTTDVPYERWVSFCRRIWKRLRLAPEIVLDMGCGTGTLTKRLAEEGYDMIGADRSEDMLFRARAACEGLPNPPLFICQAIERLDLYGTVDAAVSSLDTINYVTDRRALQKGFSRIRLFLVPGGTFIFDVRTPRAFSDLHKRVTFKEAAGVFCAWETSFSPKSGICTHAIELFIENASGLWRRETECHRQRAYEMDELISFLKAAGFCDIAVYPPFQFSSLTGKEERWFFVCR